MKGSPAQGMGAQGAEKGAHAGRLPRAEKVSQQKGRLTGCQSPSEGRRVRSEVCAGRQSSVGSWHPSGVRMCLCGRVAQHSTLDPRQGKDDAVGLRIWVGCRGLPHGGSGAGRWSTGRGRRVSTWERGWMVAIIHRESDCTSK